MNKVYCSLIILVITCTLSCRKNNSTDCNCNFITPAADKYNYPVKPGTPEWNAGGTAGGLDSIYKLCQVPQNLLTSMSTIGLIQSLEDNPCLGNVMLRTNLFQGRNEVLLRLNVSWELNKRNDAAAKIMIYYNQKNPCCAETLNTDLEKGKFSANWVLFDLICTQDSLINQLQLSDKKQFARIIIDKYNIQLKYPYTFGLSKTTSILVLSQLMKNAPFQSYIDALQSNPELNYFASTSEFTSPELLDAVLSYSKLFITN